MSLKGVSGSLLYLKGQAISSIPSVIGRKGEIEKSWSQIWLDWIHVLKSQPYQKDKDMSSKRSWKMN